MLYLRSDMMSLPAFSCSVVLWAVVFSSGVFGGPFGPARKLPPYIQYCHQDDPRIDDCFRRTIDQIRPYLVQGIPELGLPRSNPLVFQEASMDGPLQVGLKNVRIYHFEDMVFDRVRVDLKRNHLEIDSRFPFLKIDFQYFFKGELLLFSLDSSGPGAANFTNFRVKLNYDGHRITKKGKEYFKFDRREVGLDRMDFAHLQLENIFGDNDFFNDQINSYLNSNWSRVMDVLRPIIDIFIRKFVLSITDRVTNRNSIEELFPK